MSKIAIIDYGMCNIDSVMRAIQECGGDAIITHAKEEIRSASHIILPGVGSFTDAMANIHERDLEAILTKCVCENHIPFLGICLGMQLIASRGVEGGKTKGLGWIEGEVLPLESQRNERIPHIGWNEVEFTRNIPLLEGIPSGKDFYFVHSYHFQCANEEHVIARTPYCGGFTSVVGKDNIYATQFHPEKSQELGFRILKNFLAL